MNNNDETTETSPEFGMIGISRTNCSKPVQVFGSNIRVSNTIRIEIRRAELKRDLRNDYFHGREILAEVEMTPVQFANFITSANIGFGVPCSIRYIDGKTIPTKYGRSIGDITKLELKDTIDEASAELEELEVLTKEILDKPGRVDAEQKKKLSNLIHGLKGFFTNHLSFAETQFKEMMDKVVTEAKGEVQAHAETVINRLGLDEARKQLKEQEFVALPTGLSEEEIEMDKGMVKELHLRGNVKNENFNMITCDKCNTGHIEGTMCPKCY